MTQGQIDTVWDVWKDHIQLASPRGRDADKIKRLVAQAILYKRDNGRAAIGMREVISRIIELKAGVVVSNKRYRVTAKAVISSGAGSETRPGKNGRSHVTIERDTDSQMVVSIIHELLHVVDYARPRTRLQILADDAARHAEIYRLQNQTLYDLDGVVDEIYDRNKRIDQPKAYIGDDF